ncbi:MAG: Ig-like domain-containing protein [Gemmatimonadaceae bacterium]
MQKLSRSFIALGGLVALAACGDDVSVTPPTPLPTLVTSVTVSPATLNLRVGERATLGVSVATTSASVATTVTWSSSTPAVATVSATGEVAAVAVGNTTVRATSTADASKSGAAQVTVSAVANQVQSVTVAPSSATLAPGEKLQLAATVQADPGVARTVNWASSATAVATVTSTGEVTAVAAGTATITAASTAQPAVVGVAAITVRAPAPASVNIKSITQQVTGVLVPVDQNNVFGQIDVTLNVDPGDAQLTKVSVLIDGVEAASQTFAEADFAQTTEGRLVAPSEIILSVNTAAFNTTTGATTFKNGNRRITGVIEIRRAGQTSSSPGASVTQTLVFRNISGFIGTLTASGNSVSDQAGFNWRGGNLTVDALPVLYGDVVDPFNVPTIQTTTLTFGQGCDTENIIRSLTGTLAGSKWSATFPNTASPVTGGGATNNVFR